MKKLIYTLILFMMFIGVTNAAKCNVISGTGSNIGDEIACGTEHFYVLENNGETVKMLSKYNLLAGITYEKVVLEEITNSKLEILKNKTIVEKLEDGYTIENSWTTETETIVILYKYQGYNYKTISIESKIETLHEYIHREEIKNMLEDGYVLRNYIRENRSCGTDKACEATYFGGEFFKDIYGEYKTILFDEPVNSKDQNLNDYLNTHEEYQKLLDKGYEIDRYYSDSYNYKNGTTTYSSTVYSGVTLVKYNDEEEKVYQSEKAIGAHGDEEGKPAPIEIGVLSPWYMTGEDYSEVYSTYFYDYEYYDDTDGYYYLDAYYNTLENDGFEVIDINSITVSELNSLIKEITGEELPLETWYEEAEETKYNSMTGDSFIVLGSIKELLSEEYSWLYSTTYWTRTTDNYSYIFFVDTLGDLCTASYCQDSIGAGIRPVVTILSDDIIYNVKTKTDGNGTIESTHIEAEEGETIKFTITPNEGYVLGKVKVTDEKGNTIVFTDNTFTMPNMNVLIEATFEPYNPETSDIAIILCIAIISVGFILTIKNLRRLKEF